MRAAKSTVVVAALVPYCITKDSDAMATIACLSGMVGLWAFLIVASLVGIAVLNLRAWVLIKCTRRGAVVVGRLETRAMQIQMEDRE